MFSNVREYVKLQLHKEKILAQYEAAHVVKLAK